MRGARVYDMHFYHEREVLQRRIWKFYCTWLSLEALVRGILENLTPHAAESQAEALGPWVGFQPPWKAVRDPAKVLKSLNAVLVWAASKSNLHVDCCKSVRWDPDPLQN